MTGQEKLTFLSFIISTEHYFKLYKTKILFYYLWNCREKQPDCNMIDRHFFSKFDSKSVSEKVHFFVII